MNDLVRSPWTIAAAGLAGMLVGSMLGGSRAGAPRAKSPAQHGIFGAVLREILIVAAGTATRRYLGTIRAPLPSS